MNNKRIEARRDIDITMANPKLVKQLLKFFKTYTPQTHFFLNTLDSSGKYYVSSLDIVDAMGDCIHELKQQGAI